MSKRAQELADRFERVAERFASVVEGLDAVQWRAWCPNEERTVAALARHVAMGYEVEIEAFQALADGQPGPTWTRARLAEVNAEDGRQFAACDQEETVRLLRASASRVASVVRSLSDGQLARRGVYVVELPDLTVDEWIERVLIGHPEAHLCSIRAALAGSPA